MSGAIAVSGIDDTRFRRALAVVLAREGGFVDDARDAGGATNWGISLRWLLALGDADGDGRAEGDVDADGDLDADDLRRMTCDEAARLYHEHWWAKHGYGGFPSDAVATKTFDLAVNMGARQAHRCLQRALRAATHVPLADDGEIGPKTRAVMAGAREDLLLVALRAEAAGAYRLVVARNPGASVYLAGWLNRAYA